MCFSGCILGVFWALNHVTTWAASKSFLISGYTVAQWPRNCPINRPFRLCSIRIAENRRKRLIQKPATVRKPSWHRSETIPRNFWVQGGLQQDPPTAGRQKARSSPGRGESGNLFPLLLPVKNRIIVWILLLPLFPESLRSGDLALRATVAGITRVCFKLFSAYFTSDFPHTISPFRCKLVRAPRYLYKQRGRNMDHRARSHLQRLTPRRSLQAGGPCMPPSIPESCFRRS